MVETSVRCEVVCRHHRRKGDIKQCAYRRIHVDANRSCISRDQKSALAGCRETIVMCAVTDCKWEYNGRCTCGIIWFHAKDAWQCGRYYPKNPPPIRLKPLWLVKDPWTLRTYAFPIDLRE